LSAVVTLPYDEVFLALLGVYFAYSVYAKLDGRYPIAGALVLLVGAAILEATGDLSAANTVAVFVFFLLAAGVLLLLVEHVREERARSTGVSGIGGTHSAAGVAERQAPAGDPSDTGEGSADHPLDHLEDEPIAPVDAGRQKDHEDEDRGDAEHDRGERPEGGLGTDE
jgi:hypothetical protein